MLKNVIVAILVIIAGSLGVAMGRADELADARRQLTASEAEKRVAAADQLATLGPQAAPAVPDLVRALDDPNPDVRWHAARALHAIGPAASPAVNALAKSLKDDNFMVRGHAANALGTIGEAARPAAAALAQTVTDPDPHVRRAAVRALTKIRPGPEIGIPLMVQVLEDADPSVVMPALATLAEFKGQVVPVMIEAMKNPKARYWATIVLGEVGPEAAPAIPALTSALQIDEPELRMQALIALGNIGPAAKSAVASIQPLLEDDEPAVRYAAAFALGEIGDRAASAALQKSRGAEDPFLALVSTWALARINPDNRQLVDQAVDALAEALKSDDPQVRMAAARGLNDLNAPPDLVVPALVDALHDLQGPELAHIIEALSTLGPAAVPRLVSAIDVEALRPVAFMVLDRMGPQAKTAVPALVEHLKTDDDTLKSQLQFVLAAIGPDSAPAVPLLVESLASGNDDVRRSALYALGKIGPGAKAAAPALRSHLSNPDSDALRRVGVVWALLQIDPNNPQLVIEAVPLLTEALSSEVPLVRREAAIALGNLGQPAHGSIGEIRALLDDKDPGVRAAAAEALEKLGA